MNPAVKYFISGDSLYAGAAVLAAVVVISPYLKRRGLLLLRSIAMWLALAMIVMASPPFSWAVDAAFLVVFVLWLMLSRRTARLSPLLKVRADAA